MSGYYFDTEWTALKHTSTSKQSMLFSNPRSRLRCSLRGLFHLDHHEGCQIVAPWALFYFRNWSWSIFSTAVSVILTVLIRNWTIDTASSEHFRSGANFRLWVEGVSYLDGSVCLWSVTIYQDNRAAHLLTLVRQYLRFIQAVIKHTLSRFFTRWSSWHRSPHVKLIRKLNLRNKDYKCCTVLCTLKILIKGSENVFCHYVMLDFAKRLLPVFMGAHFKPCMVVPVCIPPSTADTNFSFLSDFHPPI